MKSLALLMAIAATQCTQTPEPVEPTPGNVAGSCEQECAEGRDQGCGWADDQLGPDGQVGGGDDSTCEQRCAYFRGIGAPWDPDGC